MRTNESEILMLRFEMPRSVVSVSRHVARVARVARVGGGGRKQEAEGKCRTQRQNTRNNKRTVALVQSHLQRRPALRMNNTCERSADTPLIAFRSTQRRLAYVHARARGEATSQKEKMTSEEYPNMFFNGTVQ